MCTFVFTRRFFCVYSGIMKKDNLTFSIKILALLLVIFSYKSLKEVAPDPSELEKYNDLIINEQQKKTNMLFVTLKNDLS